MKKISPLFLMSDQTSPKKRNYLHLVIGLAFLSYGSYRMFSFFNGEEYSNFRLIVVIGFIVLGVFDLYKFFQPGK
ncbi:hypothetical protein [Salinimicrobium sp. GXAS 041]|uniref:hypothetical protein n=1 Tax=Salinimicrobium sp. GXAS 041 TaxID=3400806 RepID=UPI003C73598B